MDLNMKHSSLPAALLLVLLLAGCSEQQVMTEASPGASSASEARASDSASDEPRSERNGPMTIVVFGASGRIGGLITQEAIDRGHTVVGVSRDPEKLAFEGENFSGTSADLSDVQSVRRAISGANAVIVSVSGIGKSNRPEDSTTAVAARTMVEALTGDENAPQVIQIGGASSMYDNVDDIVASYPFPAPEGSRRRGLLFGQVVALETYEASTIPWTVLTPPPVIIGYPPGGSTGVTSRGYRTATESFVLGEDGEPSPVTVIDLAKAAVDEAENKAFVGKRFTVGI